MNRYEIENMMRQEFAAGLQKKGVGADRAQSLTEDFANDLASLRGPRSTSKEIASAAERPSDRQLQASSERIQTVGDFERRYAPLNRELHPEDAKQFAWKAENGTVQSYQHEQTHRHIHIDGPSGQFFDQQKKPITQQTALDHVMGAGNHHATQNVQAQEAAQQRRVEQGVGFAL